MELFFKLFERFVIAHEKQASALAQLALSQPSVKAMEAKVNAQAEPEAATEKAPTAAEKKAAAAKAKAEAEAAKAKAEADAKAKAEAAKTENAQGGFEYEVLRALIGKTVQSGAEGTAIVKAMLADHGVKSAKEAPADKWEAMHDDLLSRLGGSAEPSADDAEFA